MDLTRARTQLEARLAGSGRTSAVLSAEGTEQSGGNVSQIQPGDEGTDLSDADRETAVLDAGAADRELIEQALERLDNGTYGRCIDCGKAIPDERLEVRPEVARCVEDQQRYEASVA